MTEPKSCLSVLKAYLIFISILFLVSIAAGYIYSAQNPGYGEEQLEELKRFFAPIKDLNPLLIMLIIFLNNMAKSFLAMVVPTFGLLLAGFASEIVPRQGIGKKALARLLAGIIGVLGIGFGVVPIIFIVSNGSILGLVAYTTHQGEGILILLASLLPHGILEVPSVLISTAIGLRFGYKFFQIIGLALVLIFLLLIIAVKLFVPPYAEGYGYALVLLIFIFILGIKLGKVDIKPELKKAVAFYMKWILPLLFLAAIIETFITPLVILVVK